MTDDAAYWRAPAGVRRAYVDGRFGQLHYRIARPKLPSAVPLLCVHSSPSSGRMYAALLAKMGRDRVALAPDTPGFGESDPPPTPPEIADYAAQMGEFLDALAIPEADIMGYHTGSKVCVELALQRPEQVRRLVLISAPLYTDAELSQQKTDHGSPHFDPDGGHLQRRWAWMMRHRQSEAPLTLVQRNFMESLRGGETAWWGHRAAFAYQHRENLAKLRQAVLVLNPEDDLHAQTARLEVELEGFSPVDLPGWSHGFCDVHVDEFAKRLRRFLDAPDKGGESVAGPRAIHEFEPDEQEILAELLPRNLAVQVYRALLESSAGEQAARMTAMDNATRNAGDMIDKLTLQYNRSRQAAITNELVEIVTGAEAV